MPTTFCSVPCNGPGVSARSNCWPKATRFSPGGSACWTRSTGMGGTRRTRSGPCRQRTRRPSAGSSRAPISLPVRRLVLPSIATAVSSPGTGTLLPTRRRNADPDSLGAIMPGACTIVRRRARLSCGRCMAPGNSNDRGKQQLMGDRHSCEITSKRTRKGFLSPLGWFRSKSRPVERGPASIPPRRAGFQTGVGFTMKKKSKKPFQCF